MVQHLLNTTAIWLLCLVAFDMLLKREAFHSYNRLYLLFTFIAGLILPVWQWGSDAVIYTGVIGTPVNAVTETTKNVIAVADNSGVWDWQTYILAAYLVGVAIAALMLFADILKLRWLYSNGQKSKEQNWTIVETGMQQSPFSIFNLLFVNSKEQYSEEQWDMLLQHELQHKQRGHFADLLLIQLSRIFLWFHPLVYLYQKRLMMIHEYEADNAIDTPLKEYGHFLVEQSLLNTAPAITHSFNRSPIKNRIVMLTRTSGIYAKAKLLILLPLIAISAALFTQKAYSQEKKWDGNIVTFRNNKFEMNMPPNLHDTVFVTDPTTGQNQMLVTTMLPHPMKMNGKKIYDEEEIVSRSVLADRSYKDLGVYLTGKMESEFKELPDGKYVIGVSEVIVDEKGKVVYYDCQGIGASGEAIIVPAELGKRIILKMVKLLDDVKMTPAKADGKNVICWISSDNVSHTQVIVRDHQVTFKDISKR